MRIPFLSVFNYAMIRIKIEMQKNLTFQCSLSLNLMNLLIAIIYNF